MAFISTYVRGLHGKIQVTSEPTGTLFSVELPFEHVHPPVQADDSKKLRNIFLAKSRIPRDGSNAHTKTSKSINRSSTGPPPTNPFSTSQVKGNTRRHSRASESPSPPTISVGLGHQSSRRPPSTSPSPPLHLAIPTRRSIRGSNSPSPPPSESTKPGGGESRRRANQAQVMWDRSDSPSPPPDKALPARPDDINVSSTGMTPLSTVKEDTYGGGMKKNSKLNILIADDGTQATRTLDETLSLWGHSVIKANDGQECHDRFEMMSDKVDVIFMELKVCVALIRVTFPPCGLLTM